MRWDLRLGELFDDLEQQADGLALAQRDAEVAELVRAEYAQVDLEARLHASLGGRLLLDVEGAGVLDGTLTRVGAGWCLLGAHGREWLVRLAATRSLRGLAERAVAVRARPVTSRLGLGSALRRVAEDRDEVVLHRTDGTTSRGRLVRVGVDFVDLGAADDGAESTGLAQTVPLHAFAALRTS
jgi:hypothetical protein